MLNDWWQAEARRVQEAVDRREPGGPFRGSKQLGVVFSRKAQTPVLNNKEGQPLRTAAERRARWKEHFDELLNRPGVVDPESLEGSMNLPRDDALDAPFTMKVLDEALEALRRGKARGLDGISAELRLFSETS